jgi:hypothetical protein
VPSTDFSLQLAISIQNYLKWRDEEIGIRTKNYEASLKKASRPTDVRFMEVVTQNGVPQEVSQILRDVPTKDQPE